MPKFLVMLIVLGMLSLLKVAFADGPVKPSGTPMLDQGVYGSPITKDDTAIFPATRGFHVGDAASCNMSVVFALRPDLVVSINNVQPGQSYPYSITQLKAATTCTGIVGLW
jgi:hypothetical protein